MTESLQQVSLQKKNDPNTVTTSESKAQETPKANASETSSPIFNAGNSVPVAATAANESVKSASIMDNSAKSSSSANSSSASSAASVFSGSASSSAGASDSVFSMKSKEKTYTADEYQVHTVLKSTFWGVGSENLEILQEAMENQGVKEDKTPDQTPVVQVQPAGEPKFSAEQWKKIDADIKSEFDKYGKDLGELSFTERIKARKLIGRLKANKINFSQFQDELQKVFSADDVAKEIAKNPQDADKKVKRHAALHDATAYAGIKHVEGKDEEDTRKLREECVKQHVENIPKRQKELTEKVMKALPETCTKEEAEKAIKSASKYTDYSTDNMTKHVAESKYSEEFDKEIGKIAQKVTKQNIEYQKRAIQEFWESPKGQVIFKRIQYVKEELHEARQEYKDTQEQVEIKTEEAEQAKKEAEKAKEEVKEAKKRAASILSWHGIKDLGNKVYHKYYAKLIKKLSPKAYIDLQYAKAKEKQAYWAEWDANAAQERAELHNKFAEQRIAYANARLTALMRTIG